MYNNITHPLSLHAFIPLLNSPPSFPPLRLFEEACSSTSTQDLTSRDQINTPWLITSASLCAIDITSPTASFIALSRSRVFDVVLVGRVPTPHANSFIDSDMFSLSLSPTLWRRLSSIVALLTTNTPVGFVGYLLSVRTCNGRRRRRRRGRRRLNRHPRRGGSCPPRKGW